MSLKNELGNNLSELNSKDIDKKNVSVEEVRNSSTKNESFFKKHTQKIVFFGLLAIVIWWKYFNTPNVPQKQQVVQNTASAVEVKEEVRQSSEAIKEEKSTQNVDAVANQNAVSDSNISVAKIESIEQWQSHIEYLFLNKQANVRLDMQYPIVEVGSLNLASNKRIDLNEYNAFIEPILFVTRGNEILLNVKIVKADEPQIFIDKSYNLSDYGFKPLYFEDCIVYNNQVYLPNDRILFFNVKSIETQDNYVRVVYNYLDQNIVVVDSNLENSLN